MNNKYTIKGIVLCPCGGQLISNTGKVYLNVKEHKLYCWNCEKSYDIDAVYSVREEGETIIFNENE